MYLRICPYVAIICKNNIWYGTELKLKLIMILIMILIAAVAIAITRGHLCSFSGPIL